MIEVDKKLTNRWQRTSFSTWSALFLEVLHESVLGPLFFNIYLKIVLFK